MANRVNFITFICINIFIFSKVCCNSYELKPQQIIFKDIINEFCNETASKYQLINWSKGGGVHEKIEKFDTCFCTERDYSIDEARELEVRACERFLELINNYPNIENLLDHYPFQPKDITVFIGFNHKPDELVNYETIGDKLALVTMHHGIIYYDKCHPTKEDYIDIHQESFEEAQKIVHKK